MSAIRQIVRIVLVAMVIAAAAAPAAAAWPADGQHQQQPVAADTRPPQAALGPAETAALKDARATAQWQAANGVRVEPIPPAVENGTWDWPSAAIGAAVPLALLLAGFTAHALVARHRRSRGAIDRTVIG
jgi:hypothetical protein